MQGGERVSERERKGKRRRGGLVVGPPHTDGYTFHTRMHESLPADKSCRSSGEKRSRTMSLECPSPTRREGGREREDRGESEAWGQGGGSTALPFRSRDFMHTKTPK